MQKEFKRAYVEITNICNLKCVFCPQTKRRHKFMSVEEFDKACAEISKKTDYIYLHVLGEPLLHPNFQDILKVCEKYNLKVNITTNGTLLGDKQEMLLNCNFVRKVTVSLHSFEAQYNACNTDFELKNYLQGVADFSKKAIAKGIIVEFRLWNLKCDDNKFNEKILSFLNYAFADYQNFLNICELKDQKLLENLYLGVGERFLWASQNGDNNVDEVFCHALSMQFGVLVDGTVVPCCLDSEGDISLGNIFDTSLDEILKCERARNILDGFRQRKAVEETCKHCGFARRFV